MTNPERGGRECSRDPRIDRVVIARIRGQSIWTQQNGNEIPIGNGFDFRADDCLGALVDPFVVECRIPCATIAAQALCSRTNMVCMALRARFSLDLTSPPRKKVVGSPTPGWLGKSFRLKGIRLPSLVARSPPVKFGDFWGAPGLIRR